MALQPPPEPRRSRPFLTARWVNLFLANYAVPDDLLVPQLPPGLELDRRDGQAFVSLVAFDFRNPLNPHNVDLLLMQLVGWLCFDILGFLDRLQNPTIRNVMDWVFTAIVVVKGFLSYVTRHGFTLFAWWRIIVGTLGLIALAMGR